MSNFPLELRDQLSIDTPELVSLEFSLAGLGSRSIACVTDYAIQSGVFIVFLLGIVLFASLLPQVHSSAPERSPDSAKVWATAFLFLLGFLFQWGYFALFEAFWNGQTPGKRLLKLRVIQQSGRQVNFFQALSRNLLRVVDGLPGFYFVGMIFLFATRRSQRLGDLVAGTLVVHERAPETRLWEGNAARTITAASSVPVSLEPTYPSTGLPADVVARLSHDDLDVMESFNARRLELPYATASALSAKLAARMTAKMEAALPADMSPETFLEALANEMRAIGRAG
jgi:uncharacterized RDD family membrane protein YckC